MPALQGSVAGRQLDIQVYSRCKMVDMRRFLSEAEPTCNVGRDAVVVRGSVPGQGDDVGAGLQAEEVDAQVGAASSASRQLHAHGDPKPDTPGSHGWPIPASLLCIRPAQKAA